MKYDQAWQELLNSSTLPWWDWDVVNNKVEFNDVKVTRLGFDPRDFKGGGYEVFTDLIHPDDYEKAMEAMRIVLRGDSNLYQVDYRLRTIEGTYVWLMDRGIVIDRTKDGNVARLRGTVIDLGNELQKGSDIESLISVLKRSATIMNGDYSFLTLCSICGKAKDEKENWIEISEKLAALLGEKLSHGICPHCMRSMYPEIAEEVMEGVSLTV